MTQIRTNWTVWTATAAIIATGLAPSAMAQGVGTTTTPTSPAITTEINNFVNQAPANPSSTIIPTDTLPLPGVQNRLSFAENFQLRLLQKLPARFYFNATCETSLRLETNPFQFPKKRSLLHQLPPPFIIRQLNSFQQGQINDILNLCGAENMVFRVLPNVTGGWTITPRTRLYCNYFMIRDQLSHNIRLNTVIHSIGGGLQRDIPITSKGNLQAEFQFRELYQLHQQSVFDFLPGLTFSYVATPRIVLFANAILQMRGKAFFQAPTKEIDPFYTWGGLYQRNGWTFSASTTLVQNFREPFRQNATIPVNNYSFICDFEVSRRVMAALPGLQAFLRAEPIYNFHSHNRPGLAGMDFRLFGGLRMALAKPALTSSLEQLRQQIEDQESAPPPPAEPNNKNNEQSKPSAMIQPQELIAGSPQPIHGFLEEEKPELNIAAVISDSSLPNANSSIPAPQADEDSSEQKIDKLSSSALDSGKKKTGVKMVIVPPFPEFKPSDQNPIWSAASASVIPTALH